MKNNILKLYKNCSLCPRKCRVDREAGEFGFCQAPSGTLIAAYMSHLFEEPPISGFAGSGTVFFTYCTARCSYCQNYSFSRGKKGKYASIEELAGIMLKLQTKGCHNINLVSPTQYVPSIITALELAKNKGLNIPIVYNTSGYESRETLDMLNGYIDIYLPDAKYSDDALAREHCGFIDYSRYNISALRQMYEQVGNLEVDEKQIAKRGLIVRHLVLPGCIENTRGVLESIARELSNKIYISFMSQFSPIAQVKNHPELKRRLTRKEYEDAKAILYKMGFNNGWVQDI